jgi:uncharacterized protein (DUF488 family)
MNDTVVYTIGHSNHEPEAFADLLRHFGVNCVVDVRSVPASGRFPQFNKAALSEFLKSNNIQYLHFGKEFGARYTDPELLDEEGKVDFEKVRQTEDFQNGVERLKAGIEKGYTIALMCSEAEPFDCHRFSMISGFLGKNGFEVKHIFRDKTLKTNAQLENQLLKKYHKELPFAPSLEEQIAHAYRLRNRDVAFSPFAAEAATEEQI